jgi:hypothetical protein
VKKDMLALFIQPVRMPMISQQDIDACPRQGTTLHNIKDSVFPNAGFLSHFLIHSLFFAPL